MIRFQSATSIKSWYNLFLNFYKKSYFEDKNKDETSEEANKEAEEEEKKQCDSQKENTKSMANVKIIQQLKQNEIMSTCFFNDILKVYNWISFFKYFQYIEQKYIQNNNQVVDGFQTFLNDFEEANSISLSPINTLWNI